MYNNFNVDAKQLALQKQMPQNNEKKIKHNWLWAQLHSGRISWLIRGNNELEKKYILFFVWLKLMK